MQRLGHDHGLFTVVSLLEIGIPSLKDVSCIWEQDTIVFCFSSFKDLEELRSNLRCGRNTLVWRASEYKKHVLASIDHYLLALFIVGAAAGFYWWENTLIICITAGIKDSNDVAIVQLS